MFLPPIQMEKQFAAIASLNNSLIMQKLITVSFCPDPSQQATFIVHVSLSVFNTGIVTRIMALNCRNFARKKQTFSQIT